MREEDLKRTSLHLGSMGHDELGTPSGALADLTFAPVLALGSTREPARDRPSKLVGVANAQRRNRDRVRQLRQGAQLTRLLLASSNRDPVAASAERSTTSKYHVPGRSWVGGTFIGPEVIVGHFQQVLRFAVSSESTRWLDWMVGTNLNLPLVAMRLRFCGSEFEGLLCFILML